MLTFMQILHRVQVDTLMVIDGEECFFNAVDFAVRDDDDVQEVAVKTEEECSLGDNKEREERDQ